MPTRGSARRQTGAIETTIGDIPKLPQMLPWVTGRFYGCSTEFAATSTTGNAAIRARPIHIPLPITVATIGCEVTAAGGAGSTQRMAIYRHNPQMGMPDQLIVDSGLLVADATGYQSATINTPVTAGWYWLVHTSKGVGGNATFRSYANSKGLNWVYDAIAGELTANGYTLIYNDADTTSLIALIGFPRGWLPVGFIAATITNATMPRVLLGV